MSVQISRAFVALCLLALAACSPFHFDSQRLTLLHDESADTLDLLVTYSNVRADDPKNHSAAGVNLQRIARGERYVLLLDWPFTFDVDAIVADEPEQEPELERRARRWLDGIEIVQAGAFVDDAGQPGVWQHVRMPQATELLQLANEAINADILREGWEVDDGEDVRWWDRETVDLLRAKAADRGSWIELTGGMLSITIPMTKASCARALALLAEGPPEGSLPPWPAELLRMLSGVTFDGHELVFEFGGGDAATLAWTFSHPEWAEDGSSGEVLLAESWFQDTKTVQERIMPRFLERARGDE